MTASTNITRNLGLLLTKAGKAQPPGSLSSVPEVKRKTWLFEVWFRCNTSNQGCATLSRNDKTVIEDL